MKTTFALLVFASRGISLSANANQCDDIVSKEISDWNAAKDEMMKDSYISLAGKALPNLLNPSMAYTHVQHCITVAKENILDTNDELKAMHVNHCKGVRNNAKRGVRKYNIIADSASCSQKFKYLHDEFIQEALEDGRVARRGKKFKYNGRFFHYEASFKYNGRFSYETLASDTLEKIASNNYAEILMKIYDNGSMDMEEEAYVKLNSGNDARVLASWAFACQFLK